MFLFFASFMYIFELKYFIYESFHCKLSPEKQNLTYY